MRRGAQNILNNYRNNKSREITGHADPNQGNIFTQLTQPSHTHRRASPLTTRIRTGNNRPGINLIIIRKRKLPTGIINTSQNNPYIILNSNTKHHKGIITRQEYNKPCISPRQTATADIAQPAQHTHVHGRPSQHTDTYLKIGIQTHYTNP